MKRTPLRRRAPLRARTPLLRMTPLGEPRRWRPPTRSAPPSPDGPASSAGPSVASTRQHVFPRSLTRAGSARVYLAHADRALVGYFALAAGSVEHGQADERSRRGMPRHPIPAVLLARLAVAEAAQGQGFGRVLVGHAASLALQASHLIAVRLLVVDALDQPTAADERLGFTRPVHDFVEAGDTGQGHRGTRRARIRRSTQARILEGDADRVAQRLLRSGP